MMMTVPNMMIATPVPESVGVWDGQIPIKILASSLSEKLQTSSQKVNERADSVVDRVCHTGLKISSLEMSLSRSFPRADTYNPEKSLSLKKSYSETTCSPEFRRYFR
jgi:hypothetical protein